MVATMWLAKVEREPTCDLVRRVPRRESLESVSREIIVELCRLEAWQARTFTRLALVVEE